MPPVQLPLGDRLVWGLQEPQLQRPGVESALVAAEAASSLQGTEYWGLDHVRRSAREVQLEVQRELTNYLVQVCECVYGV
jgi:hypothetical protein